MHPQRESTFFYATSRPPPPTLTRESMTAPFTIDKLLTLLDRVTPFSGAATWDNVGLMVGDPRREVSGILLALDPTEALLTEARARNCNAIITHHPLIFHPLRNIRLDQPLGRLLALAVEHRINIIACHTNLDVVAGGVSDILARRLGVTNPLPLQNEQPDGADPAIGGFGRYGDLAAPLPAEQFLADLAGTLKLEVLPVAGPLPTTVARVAVCGGSGSDLAERAAELGVDIYVTAEIKHATARWAEMRGFCLVDAGHYPSENPVIAALATSLTTRLAAADQPPIVKISRTQQSPFKIFYYPPTE